MLPPSYSTPSGTPVQTPRRAALLPPERAVRGHFEEVGTGVSVLTHLGLLALLLWPANEVQPPPPPEPPVEMVFEAPTSSEKAPATHASVAHSAHRAAVPTPHAPTETKAPPTPHPQPPTPTPVAPPPPAPPPPRPVQAAREPAHAAPAAHEAAQPKTQVHQKAELHEKGEVSPKPKPKPEPKPIKHPAETKAAEKPTEKPTKPVEKPSQKAAEKASEKPAQKTSEKAVEKPSEKASEKTSHTTQPHEAKNTQADSNSLLSTLDSFRSSEKQTHAASKSASAPSGGSPKGGGSSDADTRALSGGEQKAIGGSVRRCYEEDTAAKNYASFTAHMVVTVDAGGEARLATFAPETAARMRSDPSYRVLAERARAAVLSPTCSHLPVPKRLLGQTRQFRFVFRP